MLSKRDLKPESYLVVLQESSRRYDTCPRFWPTFWAFTVLSTVIKANSTWGMVDKHCDTRAPNILSFLEKFGSLLGLPSPLHYKVLKYYECTSTALLRACQCTPVSIVPCHLLWHGFNVSSNPYSAFWFWGIKPECTVCGDHQSIVDDHNGLMRMALAVTDKVGTKLGLTWKAGRTSGLG